MQILKKELKEKLENHIYNKLEKKKYEVLEIYSSQLLKSYTFDLAFKLFYLEYKNKNLSLARLVYYSHIRAYNFFKVKEYGNLKKNTLEDFEKFFIKTYESIKNNGFDLQKSVIPLTYDKNYLNGSHRISSSIFFKKKIHVLNTNLENFLITDFNFFFKKAVKPHIIEKVLKSYINYIEGLHIAFIWPSAKGKVSEINKLINNKIYTKEIKLNSIGAHNLLAEVYKEHKWVGNSKNNYKGTIGKLKECFKSFDNPIRIIVFIEKNQSKVIEIKDQIRKIFNIGKHSIHITDEKDEAVSLSKLIFNNNGIHFLNNANPYKFIHTEKKLINFKKKLLRDKIPFDKIVVTGSYMLELYGIRKARDIDYINLKNHSSKSEEINTTIIKYFKINKEDLVYDDNYFFEFKGLKFISFDQLYYMKIKRNEIKDERDVKIMKSFIKNDKYTLYKTRLKQYLYFTTILIKVKIIELLKFFKIHSSVKKIYNFIKTF
tara:strand:+ start:777 stop:2237 length:1461 start_codon:yes stop_codon:yes gene_type:complete